jgi:hypothetical protein
MAHYAKLSSNNIVIQVVVINEEDENGSEENGIAFCKALFNDPDGVWRKTSYNTNAGVHNLGGTPFRLNYGEVGMIYNEELAGFVTERDVPEEWVSWALSPTTGRYEPPVPLPSDAYLAEGLEPTPENIKTTTMYTWAEETLSWEELDVILF